MQLSQLFDSTKISVNQKDVEISGVTSNHKEVQDNYIYVCLKGRNTTGVKYIDKAIKNGACIIVCEEDITQKYDWNGSFIVVKNSYIEYARLCKTFYAPNIDMLKIVAITGTNGKTTTATITNQLMTMLGNKIGQLSTVGNIIGNVIEPSEYTTPIPEILYQYLQRILDSKCDYAVLEASSQAIDQKRLYGLHFKYGLFTNLTRDHLDYHKTMENYYNAKKKLFDQCDVAIINIDDWWGEKLAISQPCKIITVSRYDENANYKFEIVGNNCENQLVIIKYKNQQQKFIIPFIGNYNVYNCVQSIAVCSEEGYSLQEIAQFTPMLMSAKGRMEKLKIDKPFTVFIDYAHTPDGLFNAISSLKSLSPKKLTCLFGCGGNRDKSKRPIMGNIATSMCDKVIITDDNPRNENEESIISQILTGLKEGCEHKVIVDRKKAIEYTLDSAIEGEIILIAGKGHEDYQITKNGKIPFNEKEIILNYLK